MKHSSPVKNVGKYKSFPQICLPEVKSRMHVTNCRGHSLLHRNLVVIVLKTQALALRSTCSAFQPAGHPRFSVPSR